MRIIFGALLGACGGIVDIVNEYDDGSDAGTASGSDASTSDVAVPAADGGTLEWGAESGTRLKAIWWKTDDGAREFAGWHDDLLGQDCTFIHATDGVDRCVPPAPYISVYGPPNEFEDAACTIPVLSTRRLSDVVCALTNPTPGGLYATAIFSAPTGGGSCGIAYEIHPLKQTGTLANVYEGPSCTQQAADPTLDYYEYGDAVPPSTFVGSKTAPEPSSTRLTFVSRTTDDGAREHLNFYDTKLDATCGANRSADGLIRCLPDTTGDVVIYGDTNCTSPLEHCYHSTTCDHDLCGNALPFAGLSQQLDDCDSLLHIYPVTGTVPDGTQVYDLFGTTCSPFYIVENQPTGYVGTELAASTFVPMSSRFVDSPTRLERYAWDPGADGPRGIVTLNSGSGHPFEDQGWRDSARAENCVRTATMDDRLRCVPIANIAQAFTDESCSSPIVKSGTTANCYGVSRYEYTTPVLDSCGRERIYEFGPSTSETTAYRWLETDEADGGSTIDCTPFTPPPGTTYLSAGADVTSQFAAFSRVIE